MERSRNGCRERETEIEEERWRWRWRNGSGEMACGEQGCGRSELYLVFADRSVAEIIVLDLWDLEQW
eukprot:919599-Rhodomonas_salina.1